MERKYLARDLNAGDVRRVAALLTQEMDRLMDLGQRVKAGKEEGDTVDPQAAEQAGREVIQVLLTEYLDTLWEWVADLSGMSTDELDKQPMEYPVGVLEELVATQDVAGFIERVQSFAGSLSTLSGRGTG